MKSVKRFSVFLSMFCLLTLRAQQWAIGGHITPAYGGISVNSFYDEKVITIGAGLDVKYYKERWIFSSGINFKNTGGSGKAPITTVVQPYGTGEFASLSRSILLMTIPAGAHFCIIKKEKFNISLGVSAEAGLIISDRTYTDASGNVTSEASHFKDNKRFYIGTMTSLGFEFALTPRKILTFNSGLSNQFGRYRSPYWNGISVEFYQVNNVFLNIGLGYKLRN